MKRHGLALGTALALGFVLAWWSPIARAQSTVFTYDGAGNVTGRTSTDTDPLNCGAIGNACAAGRACCGGVCVDLTADPTNCGKCGQVCKFKPPGVCYRSACMAVCPADTCPTNGTCGSCLPPAEQRASQSGP